MNILYVRCLFKYVHLPPTDLFSESEITHSVPGFNSRIPDQTLSLIRKKKIRWVNNRFQNAKGASGALFQNGMSEPFPTDTVDSNSYKMNCGGHSGVCVHWSDSGVLHKNQPWSTQWPHRNWPSFIAVYASLTSCFPPAVSICLHRKK